MFARVVSWFSQGLYALAPPYWGKRNIAALLFSFALEIQEIEDTLFDIREKRKIANATDAQLATLASLVGQPRYTFTETEWRAAIRSRIRINRSKGLRADIVEIVRSIFGDSVEFSISRAHPAGFVVAIRDDTSFPPDIAQQMIEDAAAAGVAVVFISHEAGAISEYLRLGSNSLAGAGTGMLSSNSAAVSDAGLMSRVFV